MLFQDGYTILKPGKIAAIVTYLEMREPPSRSDAAPPTEYGVRRVEKPDPEWYRALFRKIGQDWLWFSRLSLPEDDLAVILHDSAVDVFALEHEGEDKGLVEMDRRRPPDIELVFLGVTPELIGCGAGRCLLGKAAEVAWSHHPRRFWLHTCTLDHPRALGFYIAAGFVPYMRAVEVSDDPRLTGALPRDSAPHIPIIE
jgi:GNAT superfamily N-acetyltransferase